MAVADPEPREAELVVRLFGGVEFCAPRASTTFSGDKQRALAARLALDAGRVVSADQLVDSVWGERSPTTVRASLQVHVSQIRRALGDVGLRDVVVTRPAGYMLDLSTDSVDIHRFERLATEARTAHIGQEESAALDLARAALDLWWGPPFSATGSAPYVEAQIARLDGRRLELIPVAVAASIAVGQPTLFVSLVETLVAEHPYSEPLWESLARVLYAVGRQTAALDRLATVRRVLLEELGLDPSPTIIELESQILNHDPTLLPHGNVIRSAIGTTAGSRLPLLRQLSGRDELVDDVVRSLGDNQVVTLAGPGGVGKTSIAVHAAASFGVRCRDGMCFIDLTTIVAGQNPLAAVIGALGFRPTADETALQELTALLATREQLLVVDNCEHVVAGAADLVNALTLCPAIRILATSRERLDLADEVVIDVPPLPTAVAAELFLQRAQANVRGFEPTDDDVAAAERIAILVDGLPLGVELTSPLVRSMSPREIADQLEKGQPANPRQRGRDARHASMHGAVAWSYELLDDAARTLFERFSVFEGGTGITGITAVCSDGPDGQVRQSPLVEVLDGLVSRSLIATERTSTGMLYRMLGPVQAFARQALQSSGDDTDLHLRHIHQVITDLRANARIIESADPLPGVIALERAAGNIRAAYRRCRSSGNDQLAAELVGSIGTLAFDASTAGPEWATWARDALETTPLAPPTRLRILLEVARRYEAPSHHLEDLARAAIDLARQLDDTDALVLAHEVLAVALSESDVETAIQIGRTALEISTTTTSPVFEAAALKVLAGSLIRTQRFAEASTLLEPRIALGTRRYGLYEPSVLFHMGRIAQMRGEHQRARTFYLAAQEASKRTGSELGMSYALYGLARLARIGGDLHDSLRLLQTCLEFDRLVAPSEVWVDRYCLALVARGLDRVDIAIEQLDALRLAERPLERAARAVAASCVARLHGFADLATQHLAEAAGIFASAPHSEGLADVLDEWSSCASDAEAAKALRAAAAGLRTGATITSEAMHIVETVQTAR